MKSTVNPEKSTKIRLHFERQKVRPKNWGGGARATDGEADTLYVIVIEPFAALDFLLSMQKPNPLGKRNKENKTFYRATINGSYRVQKFAHPGHSLRKKSSEQKNKHTQKGEIGKKQKHNNFIHDTHIKSECNSLHTLTAKSVLTLS